MNAIWKYELLPVLKQIVSMPAGAKIVHVATQFEKPCIWAFVDPYAPKVDRIFGVVMTGCSFEAGKVRHVGTFMLQGGAIVGHVVEAETNS